MYTNSVPGAGLALLYVEDDEITRDAVCTLLQRRFPGLLIHTACNGAKGLQLFREFCPDLVMTDIKMPVMNGIEMSKKITELKANVPIVVTSAHSDMAYFIECIEIGINRYLMKPIDSGKLFAVIEGCLAALKLEKESRAHIELLNRKLAARAKDLELAYRDLEAFSHTVSHDLRTPLTNISGYCQLIRELFGEKLDEQCREFIDIILNETITMNELIRTRLDFSKLTRTDMSRCLTNLSEMADEIVARGLTGPTSTRSSDSTRS